MRAVLDPNVIISALLSPTGRPAQVLRAWDQGEFEMVACPLLLEEVERALAYPKLRKRISEADATELVRWLRDAVTLVDDPREPPPVASEDSGDDYLIALAARERAAIVSGDRHVLDLADRLPVLSARQFLDLLATR